MEKFTDRAKCSARNEHTMSKEAHITLVCFAVKEEAAPFQRIALLPSGVRFVVTGMGQRNAVNAVRAALERQTPELVLTCGFAGGLDPALAPGAVVFEEDSNLGLADDLKKLGAKPARFHCAARVAITSAEKRVLREATGADAVEMESGHIRALCRERHIPSATIRVISDTADEDLPLDFNALMTPEDRISNARLAIAVAKSPGKIPQLLAFQKRTAAAAESLARILNGLFRARGLD